MFGLFRRSQPLSAADEFADDDVYPIHLQDVNFRKIIMVCTMRFDHALSADKLHADLARLLEIGDWRKLGGRVRHNKDKELEIHVPKQFSPKRPPVTSSRLDLSTTPIAEHSLASKLPIPTEQVSVQPNPYNLIELGVRQDIPKTIDDMIDRDLPQISLHILQFQDATLVSISWPHSLMGSLGFGALMHAWSLVVCGKEAEVPRVLGSKHDVLVDLKNRDIVPTEEEWIPQRRRLTGLSLVSFLLRYIWRIVWNPTPEVRTAFLPKLALQKLLDVCKEEISADELAKDDSLFNEEATLLAWFARFSASASPANRPVTIVNILNARQYLGSMLDQAGVYIQNMVGYSFSFLSGQVARGSLGPLVQQYSQNIKEQSTEAQVTGFLGTYRRATQHGGSFKLFYGPPDAHLLGCNSFVGANLIAKVDFSAAVLPDTNTTVKHAPPGTMTCFYYHIMNNRLGAGPDCIYLLGKDLGENLWISAALPAKVWNEVEKTLQTVTST